MEEVNPNKGYVAINKTSTQYRSFASAPTVLPNFFPMAVTSLNLGDYGSTPSNFYATYEKYIGVGVGGKTLWISGI